MQRIDPPSPGCVIFRLGVEVWYNRFVDTAILFRLTDRPLNISMR